MSSNNSPLVVESGYREAKEEYFSAVNVFCADKFHGRALEKWVYHYLLDTERAPDQLDPKQSMRETQLDQHGTYELTDYLFRWWVDEDGRSLQQRFLDEVAPTLSDAARILAERRSQVIPELWQVVDLGEDSSPVRVKNLVRGEVKRLLLGPADQTFRRPHALVFGDLVAMDEGLVPVGVVYLAQPGDRGWLLKAIERSRYQADAAGLVANNDEFWRWYEPAIRGAIRVLNGQRPPGASGSYRPALGRADLGPRIAALKQVPYKVAAGFEWPSWGVHFGGGKNLADGVETLHRYYLSDPGAWAKALSESMEFHLYRDNKEFGWWYCGEATKFFSKELGTMAQARPILADLRFDQGGQMAVRVFSPRVFRDLEPKLRRLAPSDQVLPKAISEIEPLGLRLPIYQAHPEARGFMVLAPDLDRPLTAEETAAVDQEWLIQLVLATKYRWAGGRTLDELADMQQSEAIEDFLNEIEYLAMETTYYQGLVSFLRSRFQR